MNLIKVNIWTLFFFLLAFLSGFILDVIIIFIIVLWHELGHVIFAIKFKKSITSINIYPFGGITKTNNLLNSHKWSDIIIIIGGVINQLILFLIVYLLFNLGCLREHVFDLIMKYNIAIMFFNLMPMIPLDGYLLLNYLFNEFCSYKQSYYLSIYTSIIFIGLFMFINYYYGFNNYVICLYLLFKTFSTIRQFKYIYNQFLLERYLYHINFKKDLKKVDNSLMNFHVNKKHFFWCHQKWISEQIILGKMFDKSRQN